MGMRRGIKQKDRGQRIEELKHETGIRGVGKKLLRDSWYLCTYFGRDKNLDLLIFQIFILPILYFFSLLYSSADVT